ncbi:MAG: glycosyltransferase [Pseudomonadota bacterium]
MDAPTSGAQPSGSPGGRVSVDQPAVSIVLPVHNGEAYLADALKSILAQTFTEFELIAVDDCSTDRSPAILSEHAARDPRMRVITLRQNRKLPGALNAGFETARAPWFTWTSDDNLLLPGTLEDLLAERDAHPDADILYADYRVIDAEGRTGRRVSVKPAADILTGNCIGCCFVYRREVDQALGGYDEGLFGVEDYDFWLRAARAGFTMQPINRELYLYRRHERSLTDQRTVEIRRMVADVLEREIAMTPERAKRAAGWLALFVSEPYTPQIRHLTRAILASPWLVLKGWRDLAIWARRAIGWRIR